MTSPDMQRLKHIRDYCIAIANTIERYGNSFDIYAADPDYQRSVTFSILQIGELSNGLSAEYREQTANLVQWGPMRAMRNMVAHNYGKMDQQIIWETATVDIPELHRFCNAEIQSIEKTDE